MHHKCNSAKHRIISPKVEPRAGGYGGHAEVQHNDVSEGKQEHSHHGKGSSREKRNGKVAKPVLLHQSSTEVSSTNQVEVPDTTQSSPVSISSGLNSDPDMVDSPVVTGVSSMAVASVMGSLSQSATVFMSEVTNEAVYTMSPTAGPNHHLLSPDASQGLVLAVSSDGHKFAFPTTGSSESLSMLPTNVSEELVLSTTLDGGRKIPETTMNFDPDCFLNNPKQGQTYGGGGLKAEMVSTNVRHSPPVERGFGFTTVLTKEIKTEDTSFEQQMAKEAYSSSAAAAASSSLTLTAGSSLLPSGGGLSPSTTLEQMDFSAIDSNKDYTSSFSQTGHSPHVHQTPSPSFFLQDASKPLPIEQNAHSSLSDSGGTFVMPTVKTEASSQTSSCSGHVETRIESTSSLHLMQFQANFQAMATEGEVTMETSQVAEGSEGLIKSGELQACSSEHYLQPEPTGVIRSAGGVPLLPGNVVQGLYPVAQPSLGNTSNMELSLDHFDISFSNQFSDLINDFISVEGGGGTIYGHQLVSGDGTALSQSEDGARAPFTQAEMCIPCCSPQQGGLQLSSAEGGAGTMAYMHVAEVVSAASASGTLGMLQQSGRVFMVTDYSPEWSYPEVSCCCHHHPSPALPAHLPHLPTCFTCLPPHLPHLSCLPHLPTSPPASPAPPASPPAHLPACSKRRPSACEVLGSADQVPYLCPHSTRNTPTSLKECSQFSQEQGSPRRPGGPPSGARISVCCHHCHLADVLRFHPCFALLFFFFWKKHPRAAGKPFENPPSPPQTVCIHCF